MAHRKSQRLIEKPIRQVDNAQDAAFAESCSNDELYDQNPPFVTEDPLLIEAQKAGLSIVEGNIHHHVFKEILDARKINGHILYLVAF